MSLTTLERRQVRALLHGGSDVPAPRTQTADQAQEPTTPGDRKAVLVVGAHPWAGASAVALALADAASLRQDRVLLVDGTVRQLSGLVAATDRELGDDRDGWSVGRRGAVEVRRAGTTHLEPSKLPVPRWNNGVMVVDSGRCATDLADWQDAPLYRWPFVLVCRATIPGLRAAEVALKNLRRTEVVLAALGACRLSNVVAASAGPLITHLRRQSRLVCFPYDRRLDVEGLDERALPKASLASAAKVWAALSPALSPDHMAGVPNGGRR